MTCDYCDSTEDVIELLDRTGQKPTVHICYDCWYAGLGPAWLSECNDVLPKGTELTPGRTLAFDLPIRIVQE